MLFVNNSLSKVLFLTNFSTQTSKTRVNLLFVNVSFVSFYLFTCSYIDFTSSFCVSSLWLISLLFIAFCVLASIMQFGLVGFSLVLLFAMCWLYLYACLSLTHPIYILDLRYTVLIQDCIRNDSKPVKMTYINLVHIYIFFLMEMYLYIFRFYQIFNVKYILIGCFIT